MRDLEEHIARVHNAEVRPLVREAYRCYTAGAARAAIVLTWTAVCADLIDKARVLQERGEAQAGALNTDVDSAQGSLDTDAVRAMQRVENSLLDTAVELELIDVTQRLQLERLKDDRNLCAHPSLRPLGELFEPPLEYARAHLAIALDAVLVHPASQGRKVVDSFAAHVLDAAFVGDPDHIAHAFYRRVRPAARRRVVEFAARHAMLEPLVDSTDATALADRMATCLGIFAAEDRHLVRALVGKFSDRLLEAPVPAQRRAMARLGDLDMFWAGLDEPMRSQLDAIVRDIGNTHAGLNSWETPKLGESQSAALSLVALSDLRIALPSLEPAFLGMKAQRRAAVIAHRPSAYFAAHIAQLMADAGSYDEGELIARTALLPCAPHLTLEQTQAVLRAWQDNPQCWGRAMPGYAVNLYHATANLGPDRDPLWSAFLQELVDDEAESQYSIICAGIGPLSEA